MKQFDFKPWAVAATLMFAALAAVAATGASAGFDRDLLLAMRAPGATHDPIGPNWVEETARDVTALGGTPLLSMATLIVALSALANGHVRLALFTLITVAGAQIASETLKGLFARPRPDLAPHEVAVYSASMPSGHSMMAAACFFTLAYVLAREQKRRRNRIFLYGGAASLVFLIGLSRIYLGVHWPTDVLAGWSAGLAWAAGAALAYRRLVRAHDPKPCEGQI